MEKQYKTQIRDFLVKYTAQKLDYPENICDQVIAWVYKDAAEKVKDVASIELSGFGNLSVSKAKLRRRLNSWYARRETLNYTESENYRKLTNLEIAYLETKIRTDEIQLTRDMGGMEKPSDAPGSPEGEDRTNLTGAPGDM